MCESERNVSYDTKHCAIESTYCKIKKKKTNNFCVVSLLSRGKKRERLDRGENFTQFAPKNRTQQTSSKIVEKLKFVNLKICMDLNKN
jgi:hypothetical protein